MAKKSAAEKVGSARCADRTSQRDVLTTRLKPSALVDTRVIYCGERWHAAPLEQLKKLPDAGVDLIYIDPPFNSNRNYEIFWGETRRSALSRTATPARAQGKKSCLLPRSQ